MGMIYKRGEVFWVTYQSFERPIRQSSGTTKKMEFHRILSKGKIGRSATCLPSCKMHRAKWLAGIIRPPWPTPRLTLPS